jgi:hypothetical protein
MDKWQEKVERRLDALEEAHESYEYGGLTFHRHKPALRTAPSEPEKGEKDK